MNGWYYTVLYNLYGVTVPPYSSLVVIAHATNAGLIYLVRREGPYVSEGPNPPP